MKYSYEFKLKAVKYYLLPKKCIEPTYNFTQQF